MGFHSQYVRFSGQENSWVTWHYAIQVCLGPQIGGWLMPSGGAIQRIRFREWRFVFWSLTSYSACGHIGHTRRSQRHPRLPAVDTFRFPLLCHTLLESGYRMMKPSCGKLTCWRSSKTTRFTKKMLTTSRNVWTCLILVIHFHVPGTRWTISSILENGVHQSKPMSAHHPVN